MPSYSLFPSEYVRPSPPPPRTRSYEQKKPPGLRIITQRLPSKPGPPPDKPLPPLPGTVGSALVSTRERPPYANYKRTKPPSKECVVRGARAPANSVIDFFGAFLHELPPDNGSDSSARSPSLRPIPSSPTLRRRHLPKIRTRPLPPEEAEDQTWGYRKERSIDAARTALLPSESTPAPVIGRRASFGPDSTLSAPAQRTTSVNANPSSAGIRLLKRSDHRRAATRVPAPLDLSLLPVVPVDLSLYLGSPMVDHAAFARGEKAVRNGAAGCFPVPVPARRPCRVQVPEETASTLMECEPEIATLRQLRRKARFSMLRTDGAHD